MYQTVYVLEPNAQSADRILHIFRDWGCRTIPIYQDSLNDETLTHFDNPGLLILGPNVTDALGCLRWSEQWNLLPVIIIDREPSPVCDSLHCEPNVRFPLAMLQANLRPAVQHCLEWTQECLRLGVRGEIQVRFPSHSQHLERFLKDVMNSWLYPQFEKEDESKKFYLATKEMGINAIEWGNRKNPALKVRINYRLFHDRVEIRIRDHGPGFDPNDLPHAAKSHDPLQHVEIREASGIRDGGFGIMMARAMVDELQFNSRGNEVMLRKNITNPAKVVE